MDGSVRALIADDEPLARDGIRLHLARHPDVVIAGEAGDGDEAVALIEELKPDLVFLDVQMPALDGFGVLESIADRHLPVVVFVTAYDKYAIRAFDMHAFDYLLKPFPAARFDQALRRARDEIASRGSHANRRRLLELLASRALESPYVTRFVVRQGERHLLVKAADV